MMVKKNHSFHMVDYSPWPLLNSLSLLVLLVGVIEMFSSKNLLMLFYGAILVLVVSYQWWRDISRESTFQGLHTIKVILNMKWGMILFIISEIFFFFSFFWSFFHMFLSSSVELGLMMPPMGIYVFNPLEIPLLNTILLLSSGISVTSSHHYLMENSMNSIFYMKITIMLGILFTILQLVEYWSSYYTISDSFFGSLFFMSTGFHGVHVVIGSIYLFVSMMRMNSLMLSSFHHFGFEASSWYWHFVDVVWLFLYINIYWLPC